jgi:penicillin-binding protein 1B
MVSMMQDVLRYGTGASVRSRGFNLPAAGKTGTSHDGWFAGFTSNLLCVVWVGFDDNRELNLEGAKSALPIWTEFMKQAAKFQRYEDAHAFQTPPGIVSARICPESGDLAGPYCPEERSDVFISGTQPAIECRLHAPGVTQYADRVEETPGVTTRVATNPSMPPPVTNSPKTVPPAAAAPPAATNTPKTVAPVTNLAPNVPPSLPIQPPKK